MLGFNYSKTQHEKSNKSSSLTQRQEKYFWFCAVIVAVLCLLLFKNPIIFLPLAGIFYGLYDLFFSIPKYRQQLQRDEITHKKILGDVTEELIKLRLARVARESQQNPQVTGNMFPPVPQRGESANLMRDRLGF